jgi:hypothetical protein
VDLVSLDVLAIGAVEVTIVEEVMIVRVDQLGVHRTSTPVTEDPDASYSYDRSGARPGCSITASGP